MLNLSCNEIDDFIETFCVPVWEANDEKSKAESGYVLACVVDYFLRQLELKLAREDEIIIVNT